MPTYRITVLAGGAADQRRAAIARAITAAHHEVTGAPPYFAQVIFEPVDKLQVFIGGAALDHDHAFVHGFIRDGRSAVSRRALVRRLTVDVAAAAQLASDNVWVYITELPANHMVEFGRGLPEAGDEAQWAEALPPAVRAFMQGHRESD